jgi:hypothetical protein
MDNTTESFLIAQSSTELHLDRHGWSVFPDIEAGGADNCARGPCGLEEMGLRRVVPRSRRQQYRGWLSRKSPRKRRRVMTRVKLWAELAYKSARSHEDD